MQRQLKYLKRIAKDHLLVVIFFENTELKKYIDKLAVNVEEIYAKTIAEKFAYEKKRIVKELEKCAIHSILTAPENLSVNTINKYLELKARGLI
jgi:ABC-type Zn uptake system ZnuABC Zn-binding protein ZnuA